MRFIVETTKETRGEERLIALPESESCSLASKNISGYYSISRSGTPIAPFFTFSITLSLESSIDWITPPEYVNLFKGQTGCRAGFGNGSVVELSRDAPVLLLPKSALILGGAMTVRRRCRIPRMARVGGGS